MHLSRVGVAEASKLQVDNHQTTQPAMKQQKIDPKPLFVDTKPPLPSDKSEIVTHLQEKCFQFTDNGFFHLGLRILVLQAQKLQDQRILDLFIPPKSAFFFPPLFLPPPPIFF